MALSILIVSSISVGASSYLNAAGRPGTVACGAGALGVVWIVVTAVLLPVVGVAAIGIGSLCGGLLEAFILDRAISRAAGVAPYRPLLRPLAVALLAGTIGCLVCYSRPVRLRCRRVGRDTRSGVEHRWVARCVPGGPQGCAQSRDPGSGKDDAASTTVDGGSG